MLSKEPWDRPAAPEVVQLIEDFSLESKLRLGKGRLKEWINDRIVYQQEEEREMSVYFQAEAEKLEKQGKTAQAHRHFTDQILQAATGWHRYRWAAFARVARRIFRFIGTVPEGDFYVRALAVEPLDRGAGIGTFLLGFLEDTARAAGAKRFALDVAAKNRDARRLYERLGMTAEAESRRWFRLPNTNLIRMVKAL